MNKDKQCPRCEGGQVVKNGKVSSKQRWLCKECGYNFTRMVPRGVHPGLKALAILMYSAGSSSYGMIARLLGVSRVSVYKWVRKEAEKIGEPNVPLTASHVEIDEMWHFVGSKKTSNGSSRPWIACKIKQSHGWLGLAIGELSESSTAK